MALFSGCRFSWLELGLGSLDRDSLVVFRSTSFDRFRTDPQAHPRPGLHFEACTTGPLSTPAEWNNRTPLPLTSLLPWYEPR